MKRTTLFAEEELLVELKQLAKAQKRPVAEIVREALRQYLSAHRRAPRRLSFLGIGASGRTDLSEKAEELYREHLLEEYRRS